MSGIDHHNARAVEPPNTKRVTLRIAKPLVTRMDRLVKDGLYMDRSAVVRESIRASDLRQRTTQPDMSAETVRISLRLPSGMLTGLDRVCEDGTHPHRSGAIRDAIRRHVDGGGKRDV